MSTEKRLADVNELKDIFCAACSTNKRYKRTNDECRSYTDSYGNGCFKMRLIDAAHTVDAVGVVRCKECKWWENGKDYKPYCNHWKSGLYDVANANDFCSYGERRTEITDDTALGDKSVVLSSK